MIVLLKRRLAAIHSDPQQEQVVSGKEGQAIFPQLQPSAAMCSHYIS
jgi:hypothetical protein